MHCTARYLESWFSPHDPVCSLPNLTESRLILQLSVESTTQGDAPARFGGCFSASLFCGAAIVACSSKLGLPPLSILPSETPPFCSGSSSLCYSSERTQVDYRPHFMCCPSFKDHGLAPSTQFLKAASSYMLSSLMVNYNGRTSPGLASPYCLELEVTSTCSLISELQLHQHLWHEALD